MEFLLSLFLDNWAILAPIIYEFIARLWPSKWNISILDTIWKIVNFIVPNNRKPDGTEVIETDSSGALVNKIKVKVGRHVLRVLIPLFMVTIGLTACHAQTWQNYKGIRLVNNSDTTKQLPVQGSLFYDDVADSLYLYNGVRWLNLSRGAGGDSGLKTASNGLTAVGSDVQLGGPLTNDVILTTTLANYFGITGEGDPKSWFSVRNTYADFGPSQYATLRANPLGLTILGSIGTLNYATNKFSSYTDRTVPDWGNVKARTAIPAGRIAFGNSSGDGITSSQAYRVSTIAPFRITAGQTGLGNGEFLSVSSSATTQSMLKPDGVQTTLIGTPNINTEYGVAGIASEYTGYTIASDGSIGLQAVTGVILSNEPATVTTGPVLARNSSTGEITQRTNISSSSAGNYNPTITGTSANIDAATEINSTFMQVGNIVNVYSTVSLDLNTGGATIFRVSLPFPATFLSDDDVIGLANPSAVANTPGTVNADTSTNTARVSFTTGSSGTSIVKFTFSYNKGSE